MNRISFLMVLITCFTSCQKQYIVKDHDVFIKAGKYKLGSPVGEQYRDPKGEEDIRTVTLSAFYISPYEVTEGQYYSLMNPDFVYNKNDNYPVVDVSWHDAVLYCNRRSEKEGFEPAYTVVPRDNGHLDVIWNRAANGYRLPTIDEWEAACRAGTRSKFYTGRKVTKKHANFQSEGRRPIGSYEPNKYGLYDMMGNVSEWCWKDEKYGFLNFKGGSWIDTDNLLRSSCVVYASNNDITKNYIGFRVVRNVLSE